MTRPGLTHERLFAVFILGVVLFTPPFLGIFNGKALVLGVPVLALYLFTAWAIVIAVVAAIVHASDDSEEAKPGLDEPPRSDAGQPWSRERE